jgi:hypothetical protein
MDSTSKEGRAVEVPPALASTVLNLAGRIDRVISGLSGLSISDEFGIRLDDIAAELRRLLQPEPTCPNCGHTDDRHTDDADGCWRGDEECDCRFTHASLPQVRALLAAERDSKPAPTPGPELVQA